jgi:hypothetical protein
MTTIDVPKIVVLIVVCTAAFITILGVLSLVIALLCKITVDEEILLPLISATSTAGGLLGGMLIKTKPESEPKP